MTYYQCVSAERELIDLTQQINSRLVRLSEIARKLPDSILTDRDDLPESLADQLIRYSEGLLILLNENKKRPCKAA